MALDKRLKFALILVAVGSVICFARLWFVFRVNTVILTQVVLPKPTNSVSPPSFSPLNREFLFRPFNTSSSDQLIAVSAYWQPVNRNVRVFLLKQLGSQPQIQCSFESADGRVLSEWSASHDCSGRPHRFYEWKEFTATLRGCSVCCTHSVEGYILNHSGRRQQEYTTLRLAVLDKNSVPGLSVVRLPIGRALPDVSQVNSTYFPHKFAVCITPIFNSEIYSSKYLVEYLEMHRAIGAQLIIVYLSAKPTAEVSRVLAYYEARTAEQQNSFKVTLVHWYLASYMKPEATWARTQIIAYNDCIYRHAHQAEYFVLSDLDEILVPAAQLGYSWNNLVSALQVKAGANFRAACSCSQRFWLEAPTEATRRSVFYAERVTRPGCIFWRKCFVQSGIIRLFHVHHPLEPWGYYAADALFSDYHYRHCYKNNNSNISTPCVLGPGERVLINRNLWPLRDRVQSAVDLGLAESNRYSPAEMA